MTAARSPALATLAQHVAAEIRAEMARQRKTQRDLSREMGVVEPWLSRRLNAHVPLAIDDVDAIAERLGVAPIELLRRAEESRRQTTLRNPPRRHRASMGGPRRPLRLHVPIPLAA